MRMKRLRNIILAGTLFCMAACYPAISGRVIDARTQLPIEGALVIVLWPEDSIFSNSPQAVHSYSETITTRNGQFSLSGEYSPFVDTPEIIIYKRGYMAWRNDYVFPGNYKRADYHEWQDGYLYKLAPMKGPYSREGYRAFLRLGMFGFGNVQSVSYTNMVDEIEKDFR